MAKIYKDTRKYKCPLCDFKALRGDLPNHVQEVHEDEIPEGKTAAQLVFDYLNKNRIPKCMIDKRPVAWNEDRWMYEKFCSERCKQEYVRMFKKERMVNKYGTEHLLNDMEHQNKMLNNRSISGTYKFADGGEHTYVGTYEKDRLEFMDVVLGLHSNDIVTPGPVVEYVFKGEKHKWITDCYIIPFNLVIDDKPGGNNKNTHPGMQLNFDKQNAKESAIIQLGTYNYIRLTDKDFSQLLSAMAEIKHQLMFQSDQPKPFIRINEETSLEEASLANGLSQFSRHDLTIRNMRKYRESFSKLSKVRFDKYITGIIFVEKKTKKVMGFIAVDLLTKKLLDIQINDGFDKEYYKDKLNNIAHNRYIIESGIGMGALPPQGMNDVTVTYNPMWIDDNDKDIQKPLLDIMRQETKVLSEAEESERELAPVFIVLTRTTSTMAKLIQKVTKDEYSHSSISFDITMRHMYSFSKVGFTKESKKQFQDTFGNIPFAVYGIMIDKRLVNQMKKKLEQFKNTSSVFKYNLIGLVGVLLKAPIKFSDRRFCSEFVDEMFKLINVNVSNSSDSALTKPQDFKSSEVMYKLFEGNIDDYNYQQVKKIIDKIPAFENYIEENGIIFNNMVDFSNMYKPNNNIKLELYQYSNDGIVTEGYAVGSNMISNKLFTVQENKITIVNKNEFLSDKVYSKYRYIGDKSINTFNENFSLLNINEEYRNDLFYTLLTDSSILTPDQLVYDSRFKLVTEGEISISESNEMGINIFDNETKIIIEKITKDYPNVSIREDVEGYFVCNNTSRSISYDSLHKIPTNLLEYMNN